MMDGHEGHNIIEHMPCEIHDGMMECLDCGERLITPKHAAEFIELGEYADDLLEDK
jgi:hypothetical protein